MAIIQSYNFKGRYPTVDALPEINNNIGDLYLVGPEYNNDDTVEYLIYVWLGVWAIFVRWNQSDVEKFNNAVQEIPPQVSNRTVKVTVKETRPRYTELSITIPEYIPNGKINDYIMAILRIMKSDNAFTFNDDPDNHPTIEAQTLIEDPDLMSEYQRSIGESQIISGWYEIY